MRRVSSSEDVAIALSLLLVLKNYLGTDNGANFGEK
jgi:hypothetical protein